VTGIILGGPRRAITHYPFPRQHGMCSLIARVTGLRLAAYMALATLEHIDSSLVAEQRTYIGQPMPEGASNVLLLEGLSKEERGKCIMGHQGVDV
jgi:hypothetical protein